MNNTKYERLKKVREERNAYSCITNLNEENKLNFLQSNLEIKQYYKNRIMTKQNESTAKTVKQALRDIILIIRK